jgi:predicted nucleotidyltransferase component of viral defense system
MNLFDKLVGEALKNQPTLSSLRMVVEKELLHHDILRALSDNSLLKDLTFIGGTCLRCCYGGIRLSEDLDFTGGANFNRIMLANMGNILKQSLEEKYGLVVTISEPIKDKNNVDTWKIKIETRPHQKDIPAQHINIDICAISSYEKQPMLLLNPYQVDMGTSGLIIQAQSREEIYADKLVAFALRPNRLKYRDLWDIMWLHGLGIKPRLELIPLKIDERHQKLEDFFQAFTERQQSLVQNKKLIEEFKHEMQRFLPFEQATKFLAQDNFWDFIAYLLGDLGNQMQSH